MNYNQIAKDILTNVGGSGNVKGLTHCFTRLRFQLKDSKKANKETIEHLEGVISVVESGGQFQVVLGTKVNQVYDAIIPMISIDETTEISEEKVSIWNRILIAVSAMFTPMVPAIAASGLLKGFLTIAKIMAAKQGVDITVNQTYTLIMAGTDALFYFMPVILAYTSAKVFKANEFIAMALGGTMCYPSVVALMTGKDVVSMFGVTITKASYASSVIPIIIGVFILSYVQKFLEKVIPEILKIILVPGLSLLVMLPATFMVFGPIGIYIGNAITFVYTGMMNLSPAICGAFIGGMWCVFVIFGAHRALLPIGINDVAQFGHQNLLAFAGAANFSQGGAALGVMLKTKNKDLKTVAASAAISASVCGITEPAIYGCNLRLKRPMIYAIICGAIGGAIMGVGGVYGDSFANNGILTFATYAAFGMKPFVYYLVGVGVSFFGAMILTYLFGFDEMGDKKKKTEATPVTTITKNLELDPSEADFFISSPIEGEAVSMTKVNDEVFSSMALGNGIAIIPEKGEVVAPEDCTVTLIYPTLHALGLMLDNGVEMIIHVGINTVQLEGKHFKKFVEEGSHIKKGTKILSFDIDALKKEGYDTIVPIIVSNTPVFQQVSGITGKGATLEKSVIAIKKNQ
ncbi:PTS system beta-glucoside-specific IIA component (Glc family) /PTS system beta-glucoside-specific IIB component (Glc family) /PTS system beta-glucoside-specific IIC component (Glc family) [Lacrimispora xylanisolvens]|uniref:PTS system beta-glucoside-specific IIA component (Glc family) /PTS system beta-glucoside-specific IIB component (Glc family) /PTS system beta-glucoside-specific IIC component (Glc family) n=1 Tax=Lacrimispora xylanisolvens TaxID=384636 RepID=A0A2S6HX93_9FIRM|nr:beta-glucoside-specific PTS transporter subunit IIABC [Hungatella xylanolytica]PPK82545.1 PTS system beta-glucoside-specific IIA component (Glc family) /PTS system beta-glucoside-specific IIB component (Glc family) /PTS system beta-glucoside-specific IIC component (Glc family) [Hungatella xylanolytica]